MAKVIKKHPVYSDYGATEDGTIISFKFNREVEIFGGNHQRGYNQFRISLGRKKGKTYLSHRFIWECWNGVIPPEMCIHHLDNDKKNNQLDNLMMVTDAENRRLAILDGIPQGGAAHKRNRKTI